jgi:hypothetical protein
MSHGRASRFASACRSLLAVLRMPESKDNWKLSAQEMQDGDAWAQETYDKYFISQPKLLKQPRLCTAEDAN